MRIWKPLCPAMKRCGGRKRRKNCGGLRKCCKIFLDFIQAADRQVPEMNSFMLVRHGSVVAEGWWTPYAAETPHVLYSLSKSFTSTAVGLAVAEGKLSIDDEVLKFFPEDAPPAPADNLKAMRVRDLLCMSAGHQTDVRLAETNEFSWT